MFYKIIKSYLLLLRLARERNIYQLLDEVGQNIAFCQWRADQLFVEAEQLDNIAHEPTFICSNFLQVTCWLSANEKKEKFASNANYLQPAQLQLVVFLVSLKSIYQNYQIVWFDLQLSCLVLFVQSNPA